MNPFLLLFFACTPKNISPTNNNTQISPSKSLLPETRQMAKNLRTQWPYTEWTSAKAYAFNHKKFGPKAELFVYRDGIWNESIVYETALSPLQIEKSLELNHRLGGTLIVSKCAFPRHAVVLFNEQEQPVASINVCFSCGDILIWPKYHTDPSWEDARYSAQTEDGVPLIYSAHEEILPIWEELLIQEVSLPPFVEKP